MVAKEEATNLRYLDQRQDDPNSAFRSRDRQPIQRFVRESQR